MSEIPGSKVVNEWIEAAIQATEAERQLVGGVNRAMIEKPENAVSKHQDVVGSEAQGENQQDDRRQPYGYPFLSRLGVLGKFAYDADVAEGCDAERTKKKDEDRAEKKGRPG